MTKETSKNTQKKFEYLIGPYISPGDVGSSARAKAELENTVKQYNQLGQQGWEAFFVDNPGPGAKSWVLFKREIVE